MSKRRLNSAKIAKQPLLKKKLAAFCAEVDVKLGFGGPLDIESLLANGHRGFISLSEEELAKQFDKRKAFVDEMYINEKKKKEDEARRGWASAHNLYNKFDSIYEQSNRLADEIFEEIVLR